MTNEKIKYGLKNKKLALSFWEKFSHYEIVFALFIMPLITVFMYLKDFFSNTLEPVKPGIIWISITFSVIGVLFIFIQKNRLKLKQVTTSLDKSELEKIIENVAKDLEWHLYFSNSKAIVAKTHPNFLSGSWGEQITILFSHNKVYVNSICDPNKHSSVVSFGRNRRNEVTLIRTIKKTERLSSI
ncbi:conserved protein of unknown function [Tenacibaculum sp. 190130A14a]|uniref:Uncharacterized protein n=1 Tax=Tenacibaculum polynesiense TaxID=3137857 RepID=A0ABP1EZJ0_9FLAO